MSDGIWSAVSGAVGQLASLDIAANNVANASTPGFRADHLVFREVLGRAKARAGSAPGMRYTSVGSVMADQGQGAIVRTGRSLDVAIRGEGYFAIATPRGERYSRLGDFQIAKDGTLTTREGDAVLGADRKRIRVPAGASKVLVAADGSLEVDGNASGQILTVQFDKKVNLEKEGAVLLRPTDPTARALPFRAALEPGALEQSNLSAVKGMMDIVTATRSFDACERVIDAFRDADRRAAMAIAGRS